MVRERLSNKDARLLRPVWKALDPECQSFVSMVTFGNFAQLGNGKMLDHTPSSGRKSGRSRQDPERVNEVEVTFAEEKAAYRLAMFKAKFDGEADRLEMELERLKEGKPRRVPMPPAKMARSPRMGAAPTRNYIMGDPDLNAHRRRAAEYRRLNNRLSSL